MVKGLGDKTYREQLQESNMHSLEERRDREDLIETFESKGVRSFKTAFYLFNMKTKSRTLGHDIKISGGKFKTNLWSILLKG